MHRGSYNFKIPFQTIDLYSEPERIHNSLKVNLNVMLHPPLFKRETFSKR